MGLKSIGCTIFFFFGGAIKVCMYVGEEECRKVRRRKRRERDKKRRDKERRGKNKEVFKEGTERKERGAVEGGSWMPFVKVCP